MVKEQAEQGRHTRYVARRHRHVDRHSLSAQVADVEVARRGGRRDPGVVPDLQAGGDRLADSIHLPDIAVDVVADALDHDPAIMPVGLPAHVDLACQPLGPIAAGECAQHIGHGERLVRRLG